MIETHLMGDILLFRVFHIQELLSNYLEDYSISVHLIYFGKDRKWIFFSLGLLVSIQWMATVPSTDWRCEEGTAKHSLGQIRTTVLSSFWKSSFSNWNTVEFEIKRLVLLINSIRRNLTTMIRIGVTGICIPSNSMLVVWSLKRTQHIIASSNILKPLSQKHN